MAKHTNALFRKDISMMKECVDEWLSCMNFYEDNFGADHPYIVPLKCSLAQIYSELPNHSQQCIRQYQQAKKILDNLGVPSIQAAGVCIGLADAYASASRSQEARQALISAAAEARAMLGGNEEITFQSVFLVLANLLLPLGGGIDPSGGRSQEDAAIDALADFDAWRGALDDTFDHISSTSVKTVGVIIRFACQLRLQLANGQKSRQQFEEALTNYVRVIHDMNQESTAEVVLPSGLSVVARIGLINLYAEAVILQYLGRPTLPDESTRYTCELAAEMASIEFDDWWNVLAQVLPTLRSASMKLLQDPRMGGVQASLQGVLNKALQKDAALRKSQPNDSHEAAVRQGLVNQLQETLSICGLLGGNNYGFGRRNYGFMGFD